MRPADRQRLFRIRRVLGIEVVPVEVREAHKSALILYGFLDAGDSENREKVSRASAKLLDWLEGKAKQRKATRNT